MGQPNCRLGRFDLEALLGTPASNCSGLQKWPLLSIKENVCLLRNRLGLFQQVETQVLQIIVFINLLIFLKSHSDHPEV